jgi:calpain
MDYEAFYSERSFPDGDAWLDVLREHRQNGTNFVDPVFSPDASSILMGDEASLMGMDGILDDLEWKRAAEIFRSSFWLNVVMVDNPDRTIIGFSSLLRTDPKVQPGAQDEFDESIVQHQLMRERARELCEVGFLETTDAIFEKFGRNQLTEWLVTSDFFGQIEEGVKPSAFVGIDQIRFFPRAEQQNGFTVYDISVETRFSLGQMTVFERSNPNRPFVEPGDVVQGKLGDCYLLGALSVISTNQQLLFDIFPDIPDSLRVEALGGPDKEQQVNEEGVYAVRFFKDGKWRIVVVDDYLPVSKATGQPIFAKPADGSAELWVMLVEKAYAKLHGSYEAIVGGHEEEAMQDLVGGIPLTINIPPDVSEETKNDMWQTLMNLKRRQGLIGCALSHPTGNHSQSIRGILLNHAYGVLRCEEVELLGASRRMMQIRNPWSGGQEWDGDWRDDDPNWSSVPASTKEMLGYVDADDGTWWMDFNDFCSMYTGMQVCEMLQFDQAHEWECTTRHGSWKSVSHFQDGGHEEKKEEGSSSSESICLIPDKTNPHLSPAFKWTLEASGRVDCYIELAQPSRRVTKKTKYDIPMAVILVKALPGKENTCFIESDDQIIKQARYQAGRSSVIHVENLEAGTYHIMCSCYKTPEEHDVSFYLYLHTTAPASATTLSTDSGELERPHCPQCDKAVVFPFVTVPKVFGASLEEAEREGDVFFVHSSCLSAYQEAHAPKCLQCGQPITKVPGVFTGSYYPIEHGDVQGAVHSECYRNWRDAHA